MAAIKTKQEILDECLSLAREYFDHVHQYPSKHAFKKRKGRETTQQDSEIKAAYQIYLSLPDADTTMTYTQYKRRVTAFKKKGYEVKANREDIDLEELLRQSNIDDLQKELHLKFGFPLNSWQYAKKYLSYKNHGREFKYEWGEGEVLGPVVECKGNECVCKKTGFYKWRPSVARYYDYGRDHGEPDAQEGGEGGFDQEDYNELYDQNGKRKRA